MKASFYVVDNQYDFDVHPGKQHKAYLGMVYDNKNKVIDEFAALTKMIVRRRINSVYKGIKEHQLHPYQEKNLDSKD